MTTTTTPPVTIGMPVYNGARYLEGAVRSLLDQTYRDFSLVISDNGSTDETPTIVARLCELDERISSVRQERNLGASGNFAYLLDHARSPFFMWAAHDDVRAPTFLEICMERLAAAPDALGCAVGAHIVDDHGDTVERLVPPRDLSSRDTVARCRAVFRRGQMSIYGLLRRELIPSTAIMRDIRGGDIAYVFALAMAHRFVTTDDLLITYRMADSEAKKLGPNAHLYDGTRPLSEMFRVMREQADRADLDGATRTRIRALLAGRELNDARLALSLRNRLAIRRARDEHRWAPLAVRVPLHMVLGPGRVTSIKRALSGSEA